MFSWWRKRKLRQDLNKALADGRINEAEEAQLKSRTAELRLTHEDLGEAVSERFFAETAGIKSRILASHRFTPDDEAQMCDIATRYGVAKLSFDDEHWKFRQLWAAEHGHTLSPRPVEASFVLKRGEACYLTTPSTWRRIKTVKNRVAATGNVFSIRIMKGWSYRVSTLKPVYESYEVLTPESEGTFSITNSRLVFEGDRKSTSVNFSSLVDYELYSDGIEIRKSRGPNEFFTLSGSNAEYAGLLITHFMSE